MRKAIIDMPFTERIAGRILAQEGFEKIHWASLLHWQCHYDFTATRNNITYLIEVKPHICFIKRSKVKHLKKFDIPVLFLIVNLRKKAYTLIPLEYIEQHILKEHIIEEKLKLRLGVVRHKFDDKGRILIPKWMREDLKIESGATAEIEVYDHENNHEIVFTILGGK